MVEDAREVSVKELEPGMKICKDVIKNNAILLKGGAVVTKDIVEKLKNMFLVDKIMVYSPGSVVLESSKEEDIKKVRETFNEVSEELKDFFVKIDIIKKNSVEDLRRFAEKIQSQFNSSDLILSKVIFEGSGKDCIYRHGVNVAVISALIGKLVGLEQSKINLLIYSALLHDFGIIKLQEKFQKRPDLILDQNYPEVKEHTTIAYKYVDEIPYLDKSVKYGVLMHHERCNGSGYPLKLKHEKIHPFARIIAIADQLDVLNSDKELRETKGLFKVLQIMKEKSLNELDYEYTTIFLKHLCNFYIGEEVLLSDGKCAKILQMNIDNLENPLLLIDDNFVDFKKNKGLFVKELIIR